MWHRLGLVFVVAMGVAVALTSPIACKGGSGGGGGASSEAGAPAVYVIDSTGTLFSFDSHGNSLAHVALPGPIGALNGGGMTVEPSIVSSGPTSPPRLFVTNGAPTNDVSAFTLALQPTSTLTGVPESKLFANLDAPRGIAYDFDAYLFFVTSRGSSDGGRTSVGATTGCVSATGQIQGVCPYSDVGAAYGVNTFCSVEQGCPTNGASGIAWDPDDGTIWVADYLGAPQVSGQEYGVSQYASSGAKTHFDLSRQFAAPGSHQQPYSIAVCPKSATYGPTVVVVGFIDDGSGFGTSAVAAYSTSGAPFGGQLSVPIVEPYALSCDASGKLYIADKSGLYTVLVRTGLVGPPIKAQGFAGLSPPIYGVFAGPFPAGQRDAGGRSEGGTRGDGGTRSDGGTQTAECDGSECTGVPIMGDAQAVCNTWVGVAIPFPDGTMRPSACDQGTGAPQCWYAVPNPGPKGGSFCCSTTCDSYNHLTQCFDAEQNLVSQYYNCYGPLGTNPANCPAPPILVPTSAPPAGPGLSNCSSVPFGEIVPTLDEAQCTVADPSPAWCSCLGNGC